MQYQFKIADNVYDVVADLQQAGYETYIVGGAIRDLLQDRTPKDYDISTAATPEEVREVFGRRRARLIGRRFKLVHVRSGGELFEVSTFRSAPRTNSHQPLTPGAKKIAALEEAENMIFNDNDFGTSEEDAWRRDFTVNALFYDPVSGELLDYTGNGRTDIESKLVRAIGEPSLRFEEDPVRMLRALKLVGQYGFELERRTRDALMEKMPLLALASVSRLSLELEKVFNSSYAGNIMQAFSDYGLIKYLLPLISSEKEAERLQKAIDLLKARDQRVRAGFYRMSVSVGMSAFALPFVDIAIDENRRYNYANDLAGEMPLTDWDEECLRQAILSVYSPLAVVKRLTCSACRMLAMQPVFFRPDATRYLIRHRSFAHAMELFKIQCEAGYIKCNEEFIAQWRKAIAKNGGVNNRDESKLPEFGESSEDEFTPKSRRRKFSGRRRPARKRTRHQEVTQDMEELLKTQLKSAADDLQC